MNIDYGMDGVCLVQSNPAELFVFECLWFYSANSSHRYNGGTSNGRLFDYRRDDLPRDLHRISRIAVFGWVANCLLLV